ncbi:ImcF-related family protein, partial [Roseisolibacter sp. H3M3-2]|uniref:ImcF-related family protein n=1 Tax=Roseisolibacter sp. H3M3-2 TaxID=3031323 RepID=UPI0023DAC63A
EADGPPLRLRSGLWRGGALLGAGRAVWAQGYRQQLHADAWRALVDSLRALPPAPRAGDDYGKGYGALKAYVIGTAEPGRSTPEFLAPVLDDFWRRGQTPEGDVADLARRQFAFYAAMLPDTNPFPEAQDAPLVAKTRGYLAGFAGAERIYQNMLVEASKAAPAARLLDIAPAAPGVVNAPAEVAGAFTAKGWQFMDGAFKNADRFFEGETWVVGEGSAATTTDKKAVIDSLRARYRGDYADAWRRFLAGTTVARARDLRASSLLLGTVGGAQSPLLAAFSLAARHTIVDSAMGAAFQPVQVVTPGAVTDKFVSEKNQPYANALLALQSAMEQVAIMPPGGDSASVGQRRAAAQQVMLLQAAQAKSAARQLAGQAAIADPTAAQLAPVVEQLLVAPIGSAEMALAQVSNTPLPRAPRAAPPPAAMSAKEVADLKAALNERGKALCTAFTPLLSRFPFDPNATSEATLQEVAALLAPSSGALWQFQQDRLEGLLEKQGAQWAPKAGAPVALSGEFVQFFNRAARVSDALFEGGPEPRLAVTARGIPTGAVKVVTLGVGTQRTAFTGNTAPAQFAWPSASGRDARLSVVRDVAARRDRETVVKQASGDWALFRLVAQATKVEGDGPMRAEWGSGAGAVAVEFGFPEGMPVLKRGWLGAVGCTPQVTR